MPEKTAEDGLKSKNARKQIHSKIQFYVRICVTRVKKIILLYSTYPKPHGLAQKAPSARPDMAALFYGSYHGGQQHEVACKHYNLTPPSMFEMA